MVENMSDIKSFWDGRARDAGLDDVEVTHRDVWQRWLEIQTIERYLGPKDRVLDIGCGSGYATKGFAPRVKEIVGVDFSADMIARAAAEAPDNASFSVCNVLELSPETAGMFDLAISIRCLINLGSWDLQQQAIANIASVIRPGGRYIFVEGVAGGRSALNALRQNIGLDAMPEVWHNQDFEEGALLDFVQKDFIVAEKRHFGVYDLVSRVINPALVAPDAPQYDSKMNEIAARLALARLDTESQDFGDVSRVMFLVLERRS